MHKFPSINQFRQVVRNVCNKARYVGLDEAGEPVYNHAAGLPTLSFYGTVKLHGTNAAIVFTKGGVSFQSRERVLTLTEDNAGFMNHFVQFPEALLDMRDDICKACKLHRTGDHTVAVYGEWCGGNIQKGVAITGLAKMFVIFAIKVNDEWIDFRDIPLLNSYVSIYHVNQFGGWFVTVDFNQPEVAQNLFVKITEQVEAQCPVGSAFGVDGVGEGVVWRCTTDPSEELWFKVKGEKHSASKVKTLGSIDVEAMQSQNAFVAATVTENRLEQGLQNLVNEQLKPFDMTSMGDFIRWVHTDIVKEESDVIAASGLDPKKVGGPIAKAARSWYVKRYNNVGATA